MTTESTGLLNSNGNGSNENAVTARKAFEGADATASRVYHESKLHGAATEEAHQSEGGLLKPIIFGGLDGILTSFALWPVLPEVIWHPKLYWFWDFLTFLPMLSVWELVNS